MLAACVVCFVLSAVMELFIKIPYQKQEKDGSILLIARRDMKESIRFIRESKPIIGKGLVVICGINLFLSAMIVVALPYLITEVLPFTAA